MEAIDKDHECRKYWQGKLDRLKLATEAGPAAAARDLGVVDWQDTGCDNPGTAAVEEQPIVSEDDREWQPSPPPANMSRMGRHGKL